MGDLGVVGAAQASDRIEQDHDIPAVLYHSLGLLDHHLGYLHVSRCGLVKGGTDDLALNRSFHVGYFLGAFIDQQHDEVDFRVVLGDAVGHFLQQDGFSCAGRGYDQSSLPLADRRDEVYGSHFQAIRFEFHDQAFLRVEGSQVIEVSLVDEILGFLVVDGLYP